MTAREFSDAFDTMLDSYRTVLPYGKHGNDIMVNLDEYEKSVFLTKAQEELVIACYSGSLGGAGFESTEEITRHLDVLVQTVTLTEQAEGSAIDSTSVFYELPDDVWFRTWEGAVISDDSLECNGSTERSVDVVPVTQDMFSRAKDNPFRGPNKRRVLRLALPDAKVELVSKYPVVSYTVRYLRRPNPIILVDLPEGVSINGQSTMQTCELADTIHQAILSRAVAHALQSKGMLMGNGSNSSDKEAKQ